jgi:seryl-tRNA synthetase
MPIDINLLRDYKEGGNPEKYREYMRQRFKPAEWVDDVLLADEEWRGLQKQVDVLNRDKNKLQKEKIAPKKKAKENCDVEVAQLREIQQSIKDIQALIPEAEAKRDCLLLKIGNLVDPEVPISNDEDADNLVVGLYPLPESVILPKSLADIEYTLPETKPFTHDDLLWRVGGYEPIRGQGVAGHRAYFLKNVGVLLNQAFINYGIAFLSKRGYDVLQPPYMMNKEVMSGIAQLDDFDEQLYKVSGKTDDPNGSSEKYLIATSEQPICAYHKNEWLKESELPIRYAGVSTCFRKEAGSSGRDIRGIFRVHQFEKIEQFCVVEDNLETSTEEQNKMRQAAEDFYQSLGFPYRVVCIVSGGLNDPAIKKYDLEAWFPGQNAYRELVSCSNCTDFQARGVGTRCGQTKAQGESARYCHFLNSTLCATGRAICCLLENYQDEGGVRVPEVLQPYMAGIDYLPFVRPSMEMSKGEKGKSKSKN